MAIVRTSHTVSPSKLEELTPRISEVLGSDLPAHFAAFYGEGDGMTVRVEIDGKVTMDWTAEVATLDDAFDGFKPHGQSEDVEGYDPSSEEPFYETIWSPDADVDDEESLTRMNSLRRSKLVMSVPGAPEWIVVDFAPPHGEYQLGWVYEGSELHPLALDLPQFLRWFRVFGAARWYWAFLPRGLSQAEPDAVRQALALFEESAPAQLEALLEEAAAR